MKRGMRNLLVLAVFGLIIGLIGGVRADVNYALSGTPEVNNLYEWGYPSPNIVWHRSNPLRINDNDTSTWQGVLAEGELGYSTSQCDWDRACVKYIYEAIVTFPQTADVINKVEYVREGYAATNLRGYYERTFLYYNNQWNQIYSRSFYNGGKAAQQITSGGPWYNVSKVKVEISGYSTASGDHLYLNSRLYELRAWGPEPSTPPPPLTNSCPDDDRIMKLFSQNNSHGALWNDSNYFYDICCSDIFGAGVAECNGVHTCTGTNKVLGLFDMTNSHAEIPEGTVYTNDVCYGDLECESDTSAGDSCTNGGEIVVRLYQNTNSHISDAADTNYPIKICCQSKALGQVYWTNMLGVATNKSDLNDLVKLVVDDKNLLGKNIEYEIYKSVRFWFDSRVAQASGLGFTTWRAGDDGSGGLEEGKYYFKARAEGGEWLSTLNNTPEWQYLEVTAPESNDPPVAIIDYPSKSLPITSRRFKIGNNINFNQTSFDPDDDLEVTWYFGDGSTKTCIKSLEDCDTTHSYASHGTKDVELIAKEIGRGREAYDSTNVFIYDRSINVFAIITEPPAGYIFSPASSLINFSAKDSYVSNCTTDNCSSCYAVGDLYCYDLSKSSIPNEYNLWFNWSFSEVGSDGGNRFGNWNNDYNNVVEFSKTFFEPKKHWANLKVGYDSLLGGINFLWSSITSVGFELLSTNPVCDREKLVWKTWESGGLVETDSMNDCFRGNGVPSKTCCPSDKRCKKVSTAEFRCEGEPAPDFCSEYDNQFDCEGFDYDVAKRSVVKYTGIEGICDGSYKESKVIGGKTCYRFVVDCRCEWDSGDDTCGPKSSRTNWTCPGDSSIDIDGNCDWQEIEKRDDCDNSGYIFYSWNTTWSGEPPKPVWCEDGSEKFRCSTRLPFFTLQNLIIAVIVIAFIYIVWLSRKNKKLSLKKEV